jgi:membrane associated rhomboid family serine protease
MFPLYDNAPRYSFPFINYLLIAANIFVFFQQVTVPDPETFIYSYAFIPNQFNPVSLDSYFFILTSLFLHGGILHILSNMVFLHIFGDNIEDRLGHLRYVLFYLVGGIVATLAQFALNTGSEIPMIGASGAISAVAGAYFVWFKNSKVKTLIPFFGFLTLMDISAGIVLGYWFISQVFSGVGSLALVQQGGVAFFAHIGGFVFGYLMAQNTQPQHAVPS